MVKSFLGILSTHFSTSSSHPRPSISVYHDPLGNVEDEPSTTKIGVKWDESDSPEIKLEKIITQKYIASFPYPNEAWVDLRRTGYPKLFPVLNADEGDGSLKYGDILRRAPFPNTDDASVSDIQATGLKALGGPDLQATRLWWDVEKDPLTPFRGNNSLSHGRGLGRG